MDDDQSLVSLWLRQDLTAAAEVTPSAAATEISSPSSSIEPTHNDAAAIIWVGSIVRRVGVGIIVGLVIGLVVRSSISIPVVAVIRRIKRIIEAEPEGRSRSAEESASES